MRRHERNRLSQRAPTFDQITPESKIRPFCRQKRLRPIKGLQQYCKSNYQEYRTSQILRYHCICAIFSRFCALEQSNCARHAERTGAEPNEPTRDAGKQLADVIAADAQEEETIDANYTVDETTGEVIESDGDAQ